MPSANPQHLSVVVPTTQRELDLSWAAGIIDGEGYIGVTRFKVNGKRLVYQARIKVAMCHRPTVARLAEIFESRPVMARPAQKASHRGYFVWDCSFRKAEAVLKVIEPFLFTKRNHAKMVLAFQEHVGTQKTSRASRFSQDKAETYEAYYQALRFMNRTGAR